MDLYPLLNSVRIALLATVVVFFIGIALANFFEKQPSLVKAVGDVILTLPLVLPPTVVGFFLLRGLGMNSPVGKFFFDLTGERLIMNWYSSVFASIVVSFPLMYRTARGAFESYDVNYTYAAQTLGKSDRWIFWHVKLPTCRKGIIAGTILSFARALGEYGATMMVSGYTPGSTATISTTVYQLWRTGEDVAANRWMGINILISLVALILLNAFEQSAKGKSFLPSFRPLLCGAGAEPAGTVHDAAADAKPDREV